MFRTWRRSDDSLSYLNVVAWAGPYFRVAARDRRLPGERSSDGLNYTECAQPSRAGAVGPGLAAESGAQTGDAKWAIAGGRGAAAGMAGCRCLDHRSRARDRSPGFEAGQSDASRGPGRSRRGNLGVCWPSSRAMTQLLARHLLLTSIWTPHIACCRRYANPRLWRC